MNLFDWQQTHEEQRTVHASTHHNANGTTWQQKEHLRKERVKDKRTLPHGTKVYYKTPEMERKKKGTVLEGDHLSGYKIKPNREGYTLNPEPVHALREHIFTHEEHGFKLIRRAALTPEKSIQRKEEATEKVGMNEADILKHPEFVRGMKGTISTLAAKNGFNPNYKNVNGVLLNDDPNANELYSEYVTAAMGAYRAASSKATPEDVAELNQHLNGERPDSRIIGQMQRTGRTAALRHIISNNDRLMGERSYDTSMEDDMESGMRSIAEQGAVQPEVVTRESSMAALEQAINRHIDTLSPVDAHIIRAKFGLGNLSHGNKEQDIAAALNKRNIPSPNGTTWTSDDVKDRIASVLKMFKDHGKESLLGFMKSLGEICKLKKSQTEYAYILADAIMLLKSHIKEYTREDGTLVKEHDDRRVKKHQDILGHQNTHNEEIHSGAKLKHGNELADHLKNRGWKEREVHHVSKIEGHKGGKKEEMPEHEEIKAKNRDNGALQTAERQMKKMWEAAKDSDDPVSVLKNINTSRSNTYTAAIDDYREKLLDHFGHKVDREKTATKYEKDGHSVILSKDDGGHTVQFAGGDTEKSKDAITSLQGKKEVQSTDSGKKEAEFITGRDNKAYTAKLNEVHSKYALVEADQLTTSHNIQGHVNKAYPQEIQPRERERLSSQMQMSNIMKDIKPELFGHSATAADGAPIVGKDGAVESGNGRTIALSAAYERGMADKYKDWLKTEAESFGLKPEDVEGMKAPMLVRLRNDDDPNKDRAEFAREANQSSNLGSSPAEQAWSDSERIDDALLKKFTVDEDGEIFNDDNMDFINGFLDKLGKNEAASLRDSDGDPNKKAIERIQNAVFTKVYKSSMLTELQAESAKPKIRNVLKALNGCVADFAQVQQHDDLDVVPDMMEAIEYYLGHQNQSKAELEHVLKNAAELNFTGDAPVFKTDHATNMILAIADRSGSRSKLENVFRAISNEIKNEVANRDNPEVDMFSGPYQPKNKEQVVKQALDKVKGEDVQKSFCDSGLYLITKSNGGTHARNDRRGKVRTESSNVEEGTGGSRRDGQSRCQESSFRKSRQQDQKGTGQAGRAGTKGLSTTTYELVKSYGVKAFSLYRHSASKA